MSRSDNSTDPSPMPDEDDDARLIDRLRAAVRLEDAPDALIARAIALFGPPTTTPQTAVAAPVAPGRTVWHRLADWLHDSGFVSAPALGLRAGGGRLRQLASEVDLDGQLLTIDLQITPSPDGAAGWMLAGQWFGPEATGRLAVQVGPHRWSTAIDELGEFRIGPLPSGRWQIELALVLADASEPSTITLAPVDVDAGVGA